MAVDQSLIRKCIKGEERALYQLYKVCFSDLMSVCIRYYNNQDDSAAVLNKAFLRITQNLEKYTFEAPWQAWIKRIMINTIINEFKSQQRNKEVFVPTDFSAYNANMEAWSNNEIVEQINLDHLKSFVFELPDAQKQVFNLYAIDGYSHKEIAAALEIPLGTSKWLLSEARKKLKVKITTSLNINFSITA